MDKCVGSIIHIVMKSGKEIVGDFLGFDDFVNMVLENVTPKGRRITMLVHILLIENIIKNNAGTWRRKV